MATQKVNDYLSKEFQHTLNNLNGPLAAIPPLYEMGLGGLSIKRGSVVKALRSLTIEESPRFMRGVLQILSDFRTQINAWKMSRVH